MGSFNLNNANSPGGMLTGTRCANQIDNYENFSLNAGFSGSISGLGTWAVREVTAPPPPPPPSGGNVPEPGSLMLAAAALLALRAVRGGAKAASSPAGAA